MSGLTPLVDTLLATRLAQRVDLVPLKAEVAIDGPGAVTQVEEVVNDVRLPSRAALLQQLGPGLLKSGNSGHAAASAQPDKNVTLSTAARTVSAILDAPPGAAAKIIGTEPLWPKGPPLASLLSATLAHAVANSGLFYESHLAQYAAGTRTLAQLAQEPQASLEAGTKAQPILPPTDAAGRSYEISGTVAGAAYLVQAPGLASTVPAPTASGDAVPAASEMPGETGAIVIAQHPGPDGQAGSADSPSLARSHDAIQFQHNVYGSVQKAEAQEPVEKNHAANASDGARTSTSGPAGIHPDAVALVRQQLELLAVPTFRWEGEAWPGTPMDWEIHEEQDEPDKRHAAAANITAPRSWSTRVALRLPVLKEIEVRISMVGTSLQVHLAASESATRELLAKGRTELPKRMGELGLQMTGLQIGSLPAHFAAQTMPKDDDAR
jgi:Flagellar hook-length control protein FliK